MVQVTRKEKESFEGFYRRFVKRYKESGLALQAKKVRFHERPKSRRQKKHDALVKKRIQETKEYLRKLGKLDEVQDSRGRLKIKVKINK